MKLVEALQDIGLLKKGDKGYMSDDAASKAVAEKKVKIIAKNVKAKSITESIENEREKDSVKSKNA